MATKTPVRSNPKAPKSPAAPKAAGKAPAKVETAEELRRRRAGIACFI